jgi:hypothetical protein
LYVRHLSVVDFRSYAAAELPLDPGTTTLVGLNGQGKTNLVEAIGYLATLSSHRVATDQPLVRFGAEQAVIRGAVVRAGRETMLELEINPGRANRARCGPCCSPPRTWPSSRATRVNGAGSSTTCSWRGSLAGPVSEATTTRCSSSATPC